jgi:hypothetical protein
MTPQSNNYAALVDHSMDLIGHGIQGSPVISEQARDRFSKADSLIDLDMSLPDSTTEPSRPSTGSSDIGSPTGEQKASRGHFELELRGRLYQPDHSMELIGHGIQDDPVISEQIRDRFSKAESLIDLDMSLSTSLTERFRPSTVGSDVGPPKDEQKTSGSHFELEHDASPSQQFPAYQNLAEVSDFSVSDTEGKTMGSFRIETRDYQGSVDSDSEYTSMPPSQGASQISLRCPDQVYTMAHFPDIPAPPSLAAMSGTASDSEMLSEMLRLLGNLTGQLGAFRDVYKSL